MVKIEISPAQRIRIFGLDKRSPGKMAWCAATTGLSRLFWIDGYLLCIEVYEKSFEYEVEKGIFPISQICYTEFPAFQEVFDVGRGTQLAITDVSELSIWKEILKSIKSYEKKK